MFKWAVSCVVNKSFPIVPSANTFRGKQLCTKPFVPYLPLFVCLGKRACAHWLHTVWHTASLRAQICTTLIVWNQFCFFCIEWEMFLFQLFGAYFHSSSGNDRPKVGMKWKLRSSFLSYCEEMFLRGEVILIKDYEDMLIKKENSDVHWYIIHWKKHCNIPQK